jgi:transcriptional regulator with XRE-family HTH domain
MTTLTSQLGFLRHPRNTPFSEMLAALRTESTFSYALLSAHCGVSRYRLRQIEKGFVTRPGRDAVIRIGSALYLDVEDMNILLRAAGYAPLASR